MYESFFGFKEKPFHLTPDPHFFYESDVHTRALSYLQYGAQSGEGFIVISGDIGTGKTTLANSLIDSIESERITVLQLVTSKLEPEDLLRITASKLGITLEDKTKAMLLNSIETELIRLYELGRRALLIVDEAQNLPRDSIEELRMLSNFQINGRPLLQSFLLGQKELRQLLNDPSLEQFRQRIVASLNLTPLNAQETAEYIQYRIQQATEHNDNRNLFDQDALSLMYQHTGGVPRRINTVADRVLLYGYLKELKSITRDDVQAVLQELKSEAFYDDTDELDDIDDGDYGLANALSADDTDVDDAMLGSSLSDDVEYIKNSIGEIRATLEASIQQKLTLNRYLDNAIKRRLKRLREMGQEAKSNDSTDN